MIRTLTGPLLLGVAAGARVSLGVAAVAFAAPVTDSPRLVQKVQGRSGKVLAALSVAGELVGDKLPQTPSRLEPPALGGRLVCGALGGAALARRGAVTESLGATAGVAGALAGSFGGARWRAFAADQGWPDWPSAVAEDLVVIVLAWRAGRTPR